MSIPLALVLHAFLPVQEKSERISQWRRIELVNQSRDQEDSSFTKMEKLFKISCNDLKSD